MKTSMNARRSGFTLIEILVAIAVMGVVTSIGLRMFVLITGDWREQRTMTELSKDANVAFAEIERDIMDALSSELSGLAIRGIDEDILVNTIANSSDANDRIVIPVQNAATGSTIRNARSVQYRVLRDDAGLGTLYRSRGPLGSDNPSNSRSNLIPNANIVRFDITYATGEAGTPWVTSWNADHNPKAVRVSMTLSHADYPFRQISRKEVYTVHVR